MFPLGALKNPGPRLLVGLAVGLLACAPTRDLPPPGYSFGTTSSGRIVDASSLPDRGTGYVRARPGEDTRYGTSGLIGALERAAAAVERRFPGGEPLRIGDLSSRDGGRHPRHGSHRAGRDADVIFYLTDAGGQPTRGRGWLAFDRYGVAREPSDRGDGAGRIFFFDDARNWEFVRTLLLDPEVDIQWLFVSNGIKARLLRYAAIHERSRQALLRARTVLHQPSRGNPHADHFHVRVYCGAREAALGCRDWGPVWAWVRPRKSPEAQPSYTDDALVDALMRDESPSAAP